MTEGTVTEPQYFRSLARQLRATGAEVLGLDVKGVGRDPVRVVEAAQSRRASAERAGQAYDSVWVVVDVDEHHHLESAVRMAEGLGINVAVSNPSFELWLLLHVKDVTAALDSGTLVRELTAAGMAGKIVPADFPVSEYVSAIARAHSLPSNCRNGSIPANPGTTVCEVAGALADSPSRLVS